MTHNPALKTFLIAAGIVGVSLSLLSTYGFRRIHVRVVKGDGRQPPSSAPEPVYVVYASTDDMIPGVEASIRSVQEYASGPVRFCFIGDSPLPSFSDDEVTFISLAGVSKKYHLQDFVSHGDRHDGQNIINTLHANYARFVLDSLLPKENKAMYLDVDTLVFCDVYQLINSVLNDGHNIVAAVPRDHIYGLTRKGAKLYGHINPSFNAGIFVINLDRWRALGMTESIRNITIQNKARNWYFMGSQPPLNIAVQSRFEPLSLSWNVKAKRIKPGFKTKKTGEPVCLAHWAGPEKPWHGVGAYLSTWEKFGNVSKEGKKEKNRRKEAK
mmetsp:Transcript_8121/g.17572  ORF Transcript_8121/g.17572 Transcript_8121/m.17572 type:complete len:326 (-) Transcript_8121:19-996(-)